MLRAVIYFMLRLLLRLTPEGDVREREVEILVLRQQLAVLKRKAGRPKLRRVDRMLLAAFARLMPKERWSCFIVSPQTILRWHRELVARKWTYKHARTGRPPLDPELVALIVSMARTNPRWGCTRIKGGAPGSWVIGSGRRRSEQSFAEPGSHRHPGTTVPHDRSS